MSRKIIVLLIIAVLFASMSLGAEENGVLREVRGKVELRPPGGAWSTAQVGSYMNQGTTISTGFNSQAVVDFGASEILVKPLTRMTLRELSQQGGTIKTGLSLDVGRVRAEVKTVSGVKHDFKLLSASSTASVRGTVIEGDGEEWVSESGTFVVSNSAGQTVTVTTGQSTVVTGNEAPSNPKDQMEKGTTVTTQTNPTTGGGGDIFTAADTGTDSSVANIIIDLEFQ